MVSRLRVFLFFKKSPVSCASLRIDIVLITFARDRANAMAMI